MNGFNYYVKVFKEFVNFSGRARRSEYWYFVLFHLIVAFALAYSVPLLYLIYVFVALIPGLAVAVRRMHDVGKSGWFLLIPIYSLILVLSPGEIGDNEYGVDPKSDISDLDIDMIGKNP